MARSFETELVDSALAGDIDSFGKLCDRYYSSMTAIAYSVLADHHLAEDAAQEAFVRALENLRKLKSKEKFGFWLARICRNVANDMAKIKLRNVSTEDLSQTPVNSSQDDENQAVRQAISSLSLAERQLIVLQYYNSLSHEQISSVLGLSKAAINNRLSRARRKIARYLRNNDFTQVDL